MRFALQNGNGMFLTRDLTLTRKIRCALLARTYSEITYMLMRAWDSGEHDSCSLHIAIVAQGRVFVTEEGKPVTNWK